MTKKNKLYYTTTFKKIAELSSFYAIIQGGQAAGKNWAIALLLLKLASEKKRKITIVTDTFENLKDGAIEDFKDIFDLAGYDFHDYYNKQDKNLYFGESVIQFRYIAGHKPGAGKSKRRQILYINEANKIAYEAAKHYIDRTQERVYLDFNPDREFWAHTEIEHLPDAEKIIVTYIDNELCPEREKLNILARKDNAAWFRVYGLGLTGTYSDRRVYDFEIIDEIPDVAKRIYSGMDFGASPDPTTLVNCYIDGVNLYLDEVFTENNLLPEKIEGANRMSISDKLDEVGYIKDWPIVADSAGGAEINDLRKQGFNVVAVKKTAGSVIEGIKILRSYKMFITRRSVNLKKGLENYFWPIDRNGKIVPEVPKEHEPDQIAAARYVILTRRRWEKM